MGDPWCSGYLNFSSNIHVETLTIQNFHNCPKERPVGFWSCIMKSTSLNKKACFPDIVYFVNMEGCHHLTSRGFLLLNCVPGHARVIPRESASAILGGAGLQLPSPALGRGRRKHELFVEWMSWRKNGIYRKFPMYIKYYILLHCDIIYVFKCVLNWVYF